MPKITETIYYDGFETKISRLNLESLLLEIHSTLRFELRVAEEKHSNGTKGLRQLIDTKFDAIGGWQKMTSGGVDWKKASGSAVVAVEVQVSGRSDLLAVDLIHLTDGIRSGEFDVGVIVVPDDTLSRYLTDRTPNLATAKKHVESRARDQPLCVIAFRHDGVGAPLDKMTTNLGRHR